MQIIATEVVSVGLFKDLEPIAGEYMGMSPFDSAAHKELEAILNEMLNKLTTREQYVIKGFFGIGDNCDHTLEEIGNHYSVTMERIRQIREKALRKLRSLICTAPFRSLRSYTDDFYPIEMVERRPPITPAAHINDWPKYINIFDKEITVEFKGDTNSLIVRLSWDTFDYFRDRAKDDGIFDVRDMLVPILRNFGFHGSLGIIIGGNRMKKAMNWKTLQEATNYSKLTTA